MARNVKRWVIKIGRVFKARPDAKSLNRNLMDFVCSRKTVPVQQYPFKNGSG
jgi:hypothetical protein